MVSQKVYKGKMPEKDMIIPGDPKGLPDDFLKVIVFIDNAYLLRLKNYLFKDKFKYSIKTFIDSLCFKQRLVAEKIFLYDAPPFQSRKTTEKEDEKRRKYDEYADIFRKQGIILREGRTQRIKIGNEFVFRQKGVDMLLGIDMVAVKEDFPEIKRIILLSGDSDFVPVIEKLRKQNIQVFLWTYFEKNRESAFSKSNELIKKIHNENTFRISREDFEKCKLK